MNRATRQLFVAIGTAISLMGTKVTLRTGVSVYPSGHFRSCSCWVNAIFDSPPKAISNEDSLLGICFSLLKAAKF
ncbi:UNVERIFIED_CONTAM: hypothetical protein KB579_05500 [Streptococcus canis]|uniref:hypothetical protein n=1 Tax=Streptococcus canis TaxID=1329 RepID=UPI0024DECCDE|nr:hypothetical protein [Streptococcus canis]